MERDGKLGEPVQAGVLATLEAKIAQLAEPGELLALATEIDQLGQQLAHEIAELGAQRERAAPLASVLVRVPTVYATALLRAAERFDDRGSPRRAAVVLIEALRRVFDPAMTDTVVGALGFLLEANGERAAAERARDLVTAPAGDPAARREARARFLAGLDELRASIDWAALEDELGDAVEGAEPEGN
jgi:hypothetical protein